MSADKKAGQLIRIGALQNLHKVLPEFGLDADMELSRLGMTAAMFQDGELLMDLGSVGAVLEHCAEVTRSSNFPMHLAAAQDLSLVGILALFLQTASTLGEALRELCHYNHLHHAQSVIWSLQELGGAVTFDVFLDTDQLSPLQYRLAVDLALSQGHFAIKTLTQGRVRPSAVRLRRKRMADVQTYKRFFHAPVEFNTEADGFLLPPGCLELPLIHPDAQQHEAVRRQIAPIKNEGEGGSRLQDIRATIRSLLPTGSFSLEQVATYFACDKRTLQRYLRDRADTTYQALLDDVRFGLVQQYLRDSQMPITQLSYLVGFTDPSNFARAFRKHFGISPRQWREQHGSGSLIAGSHRPASG
jgi:AraC-like DNA-binding protein